MQTSSTTSYFYIRTIETKNHHKKMGCPASSFSLRMDSPITIKLYINDLYLSRYHRHRTSKSIG